MSRYSALFLSGVLTMGACVVGCGGRTTSTMGRFITDDRVGQIAPGNTDGEWLLMLFGEPDEKRASAGAGEVWVWTYRREVDRKRQPLIQWYERKTCIELSPEGGVVNAWVEEQQSVGWDEAWEKVGAS